MVFCTATQPYLDDLWSKNIKPVEIIPDTERLYTALSHRVRVKDAGKLTDSELIERLMAYNQVLCIVNTRKHAKKLYELMPYSEGNYHLSASMSPVHRSQKIEEIRKRLQRGEICRVVSTQLIEAGVDIDFPAVYRAIAGIDSIAQAAGRCNREGKRKGGEVWAFRPEQGVPDGWFLRMANLGEKILREHDDPLSPQAIKHFFGLRFDLEGELLDKHMILKKIEQSSKQLRFPFREIAQEFKFIEDFTTPIVIACREDGCRQLMKKAEYSETPGAFARKLQKYTVSIMPWDAADYEKAGMIRKVAGLFNVLEDEQMYDENLGVLPVNKADSRVFVF